MAKLDTNRIAARPDAWAPVLEKLLHGVTHTISNRVATLAGVSDILSSDPNVPSILRALVDEVPRLEEAIRLLRLLATPDDEGMEALETTRIVDDAVSLAALHPVCRNISFEMVARRDVPPVLAHHSLLTHALVVALVSAAELRKAGDVREQPIGQINGQFTEGPVRVHITFVSEDPDLIISAGPPGPATSVRGRLLSAGRD
ncbi:MAG: hypothetical protein ABI026_10795 [Gemmatimonadaceae bacterium]